MISEADFELPAAEGPAYIQDTLEYQRVPEHIIGTNDFEKMRDLPTDSQDYQLGRKVGVIGLQDRIDPNLFHLQCTGFLVGPDLFMANHHCTYNDNGLYLLTGAAIFMDYYQELTVDRTAGGLTARVSEVLHADAAKDYALLRLDKPIGDTYGWLELDTTTTVNTSQSVKIIQHPYPRSKEIVRKNSQILGTLADYPFILAYLADTESGSSGSPVFLKDDTGVIAINHSSWSDRATGEPLFNAGTLMSYIVPEIQQWLPGNTPVAPPARPDLVIVAPQISKAILRPSESFTLSATVKNQGDAASEATTLRFYRSTDTTITTADVAIGTAVVSSLVPSGSSEANLTLTAPASVGTYYYGACVDAVNNEGVTDNNCSTAVRTTVSTAPDLVVVAPQISKATLRPGESFTLSATVRNQGDAAAQATTLRFYRSTDTTITTADVAIGTAVVSSLVPSGSSEANLTLTAPASAGMYYYGACVDAVTNEDVTNNNCSTAVRITVSTAPDLVVVAPQVSKVTLRPSESFTLSVTVKNQGDAVSEATTLRFYRSTDTTITTADVAIGTAAVSSVAPSDTREASLTLAAPASAGMYYYGACVDAVTNEDVTNNNCSTAVRITVSTAPDLVVVAPQVSKVTLRPSESFTLSATVKNQGDAVSEATTLRFYRSTDTTITTADVAIGTAVVSSLAPSDTREASLTLAAPTAGGTYYYGACVDAVTNESVTDNNCSAAVTVTVSVGFNPGTIVDQTFEVGSPVALTLPVATGGTEPYTYTLSPIPEGLNFEGETRKLVGTPTRVGTTEVTYAATDAANASASLTFTITVRAKPTFNPNVIADQTFTVGKPVNLTLPIATGGTPPYTYTLTPLPEGLSFDETRRELSGTPTTAETTTATYTATDAANVSASLTFTIEVTEGVILDVNGDGQVTVIDLVIIALFYGTQVPADTRLPADVNADSVVDILDLTAVAQAIDTTGGNQLSVKEVELAVLITAEQAAELEAAAGAPMQIHSPGTAALLSTRITAKNVADALDVVRKDVQLRKEIPAVLETFLALLSEITVTPDTTALLPNYPNPFNPETWIPYQLAKPTEVTITIYAINGQVVRQLALGHQAMGLYQTRSRAAYWDGKNALGESVVSGVYFYTLTAGDFNATRKLLIVK